MVMKNIFLLLFLLFTAGLAAQSRGSQTLPTTGPMPNPPDPTMFNDFEPPTVVCLNGLSVNIMPTGMVNLWAADFLQYVHDNATPDNQIQLGIRKAGTGVGFPATALGNPINFLFFSCNELGDSISVELWARDLAGNTAFCTTNLSLQDNLNNCGGGGLNIKVCSQAMCSGAMMEEVAFFVNGTSNFAPPFAFFDLSNASGCFELFNNVPIASTFTVSAEKDDNPLNGVTSYDLELISRHIHGIQPFTEPWQWVAADANRDGLVTLEDSVELSKLMLGIYSELPNNTSWRFVPSGYQFPSPNPLSQPIPDTISVANILSSMDTLFLSIKIGDLNCSAVPNFSSSPSEREGAVDWKDARIDTPRPNPTEAGSLIPVSLPFAEKVQLTITDLSGRVIQLEERMIGKGDHTLEIPATAMPAPGVYVWNIRAGDLTKSGKLVRM